MPSEIKVKAKVNLEEVGERFLLMATAFEGLAQTLDKAGKQARAMYRVCKEAALEDAEEVDDGDESSESATG